MSLYSSVHCVMQAPPDTPFDKAALHAWRVCVRTGVLPPGTSLSTLAESALFWLQCGWPSADESHSSPALSAAGASGPSALGSAIAAGDYARVTATASATGTLATVNHICDLPTNKRARVPSFKVLDQPPPKPPPPPPILDDGELRVYPSEHTCFLLNFWGPLDAFCGDDVVSAGGCDADSTSGCAVSSSSQGSHREAGTLMQRFGACGQRLPPLYLSCPFNYATDDAGVLTSYEPVAVANLHRRDREAMGLEAQHPQVKRCCDGVWFQVRGKSGVLDWNAFMHRHLVLDEWHECYLGPQPAGNWRLADIESGAAERAARAAFTDNQETGVPFEYNPVWSLWRAPLHEFTDMVWQQRDLHCRGQLEDDNLSTSTRRAKRVKCAAATAPRPDGAEAAAGRRTSGAGSVLVFRSGAHDAQPFGVWLTYMFVNADTWLFIDVQNRHCSATLIEAVQQLAWTEQPRHHVFYAPWK